MSNFIDACMAPPLPPSNLADSSDSTLKSILAKLPPKELLQLTMSGVSERIPQLCKIILDEIYFEDGGINFPMLQQAFEVKDVEKMLSQVKDEDKWTTLIFGTDQLPYVFNILAKFYTEVNLCAIKSCKIVPPIDVVHKFNMLFANWMLMTLSNLAPNISHFAMHIEIADYSFLQYFSKLKHLDFNTNITSEKLRTIAIFCSVVEEVHFYAKTSRLDIDIIKMFFTLKRLGLTIESFQKSYEEIVKLKLWELTLHQHNNIPAVLFIESLNKIVHSKALEIAEMKINLEDLFNIDTIWKFEFVKLSKLSSLLLYNCNISNEIFLLMIKNLPFLTSLELQNNISLNGQVFENIVEFRKMKNMETLNLYMAYCPKLEHDFKVKERYFDMHDRYLTVLVVQDRNFLDEVKGINIKFYYAL